MSLGPDDVRKIAFLARIKVDEEDLSPLADELNGIIGWVEQLGEVDTDGIDPMTSVTHMSPTLREDRITDAGYPDKVTQNAPDRVDSFFAVPKVVD